MSWDARGLLRHGPTPAQLRIVTEHECDDWHDGECSRCCRLTGPCPACQAGADVPPSPGDRVVIIRGRLAGDRGTVTARSTRRGSWRRAWVDVLLDGWTVPTRYAGASLDRAPL